MIMITFYISFLVGFCLQPKENTVKDKNKRGKGGKENDRTDKSKPKKKKLKEIEVREVIPEVEKPKYLIEVESPVGTLHIEYELLPKRLKYQVDVVCWGPVAQIFTSDGCQTIKSVQKNGKFWVPVCLEHYLLELHIDEIFNLHAHIVDFIIYNIENKNIAVNPEGNKIFYVYEDQVDVNDFVEVFTNDPNPKPEKTIEEMKRESLEMDIRRIVQDTSNFPSKKEVVSWLIFRDGYKDKMFEIIEDISNGKEVICKDFVPVSPPPTKGEDDENEKSRRTSSIKKVGFQQEKRGKSKKEKEMKVKAKSKVENSVKVSVAAEAFFADAKFVMYKSNETLPVMENFFVMVSVKNILSRVQKFELNPIVVKILKINNLPSKLLENELRLTEVYATYNMPYIGRCATIHKPVAKDIRFNESHIYFTNTVSQLKFLEFLQTQTLFVEIYGQRSIEAETFKPSLFGRQPDDYNISKFINHTECSMKPGKNVFEKSQIIKLAVCCFDLSSLAQNTWTFKEKGQCHVPDATLHQKCKGFYDPQNYVDVLTVNELNVSMTCPPNFPSPLTEELMLFLGTTLKVEVHLLAPQAAALVINRFYNTFKKLMIIVFDEEFASLLYRSVTLHNQNVMATDEKPIRRSIKELEETDIITGFLIDNTSDYVFYLEGPSNGFVLNIWHMLDNCEVGKAKVFLNTDFAFQKRYYPEFICNGGLYSVTLKVPLTVILQDRRLYTIGNVPLPCLEALKKLNRMVLARSIKSIFQSNLLPKANELRSLDLEYGVPLRWIVTADEINARENSETLLEDLLNVINKDET